MAPTEIYPWQQVANQGYGKYGKMNGKTIIGPGSREAIDIGINGFASSDSPVRLAVAQKDVKLPNLWDGGYNYAAKGDIVMTYGPTTTEYVNPEWQAHAKKFGRSTLIDRNYSAFPEVMESTYVDAVTKQPITGRLSNGSTEIVTGVKRANTGFAFLPEGTPVLSSEALKKGVPPVESKAFQAVAMDKAGCYLTPVKTVYKNTPTSKAGAALVGKLEKAEGIYKKALAYFNAGECSQEVVNNTMRRTWKIVTQAAKFIR